jgi:cell wall-associated NlpC family hydrolase
MNWSGIRFFTLLLPSLVLLASSCTSNMKERSQAEAAIEEIRQAFAPDKRVALFAAEVNERNDSLLLSGETNLPEAKEALLVQLRLLDVPLIDELKLLPSEELEGMQYGVVRLSVCNIRSKPKDSAELSTQATLGTPIKVLKKQGNWFYIQTPDGYLGWLDKDGFAAMNEEAINEWKKASKVVYLEQYGFAFDAPAEDAGKVSDLLAGNILEEQERVEGFSKVRFPDGREAFIPSTHLQAWEEWLATNEAKPENILSTAREFMGRPYLWGGTSGKGMDCSGFTKTVFFLNGYILPRDASQQVHSGIEVSTDSSLVNLKVGDFLFFGQKATADQKERIRHVSIYLGNGKMIHAAGIVKIESLYPDDPDFAPERLTTFVRAKRMLGSENIPGVLPLAKSDWYSL